MSTDNTAWELYESGHPIGGCLERVSQPGQWCPMAADHIELVPDGEWDALSKQITLRPMARHTLNQDGVGSCATESTGGAVMVAEALAGLPLTVLNPWSIYWYTSGGRDSGSSIDENLVYVREHGIASEAAWPRSKGWRAKPDEAAMEDAKKHRILEFYDVENVPEMVSALLRGFPVVFGANGHAILAVQHMGDYPLILNSWGTSWGDGGFGKWCSYREINWSYGAFACRVAS